MIQERAPKRSISEGKLKLPRGIYAPQVPEQYQHLFGTLGPRALAPTTLTEIMEKEALHRSDWTQQATQKFNTLETAILGTTQRQEKLELTAKAIVKSLDSVLAKIDNIQASQAQTLREHDTVLTKQQDRQQEHAVETSTAQSRVANTEGQLGQAEQTVQRIINQQGKDNAEAAARQLAHEQETFALKQQVRRLIEDQRMAIDLARLTAPLEQQDSMRRRSIPAIPPMSNVSQHANWFSTDSWPNGRKKVRLR